MRFSLIAPALPVPLNRVTKMILERLGIIFFDCLDWGTSYFQTFEGQQGQHVHKYPQMLIDNYMRETRKLGVGQHFLTTNTRSGSLA
jgi:hypothetical protein